MKQTLKALAVAVAMVAAGSAWTAAKAESDIVVGFATAQSGFILPYDQGAQRAAILAMEQIDAAGGVNGWKFKWIIADTKSDRSDGAKAGAEVVRGGADVVVVTCGYDFGGPAALSAQRAHKISFFECAEDAKAGIQEVGPNSFTTSIAAPVQGATMAE